MNAPWLPWLLTLLVALASAVAVGWGAAADDWRFGLLTPVAFFTGIAVVDFRPWRSPPMTTHELARALLESPDVPALVAGREVTETRLSVAMRDDATGEYRRAGAPVGVGSAKSGYVVEIFALTPTEVLLP